MKTKAKKPTKAKLPIDIVLQENILLPNGTLFIKLPTLPSLEAFWEANCNRYTYAAEGNALTTGQAFLNEGEWVFGNSKAAVVETVCRWNEMGITAKFYDWAKEDPHEHKAWFRDRDLYARELADANKEPEAPSFHTTCTPETYRGWWKLHNLPQGYSAGDWFGSWGADEITDWTLPISTANLMLREQTFDDWGSKNGNEVDFYDSKEISEYVEYWRRERAAGYDYYGVENEAGSGIASRGVLKPKLP